MPKRRKTAKQERFLNQASVILGIVRGISKGSNAEQEQPGTLVFSIDTRKYGRGYILTHLREIEDLATCEGPVEGTATPVLFAAAGPTERVTQMLDRAESRTKKLFNSVVDGSYDDMLLHLNRKLASANGRFRFEDLLDAFCRSLISEDAARFPRLAHVLPTITEEHISEQQNYSEYCEGSNKP